MPTFGEKYRKSSSTTKTPVTSGKSSSFGNKYRKSNQPVQAAQPIQAAAPAPKEPGFVQSLAQGVASLPLRLGAVLKGSEIDAGYFGKAQPIKSPVKPGGLISPEGKLQQPIDLAGLKDTVGAGIEASSYIPVVGGGTKAVQLGLKGLVKQGVKTGLKEGAIGGGLQALGTSTQKNLSLKDTAVETFKGTIFGAGTGGILGGGLSLAGKGLSKVLPKKLAQEVPKLPPEGGTPPPGGLPPPKVFKSASDFEFGAKPKVFKSATEFAETKATPDIINVSKTEPAVPKPKRKPSLGQSVYQETRTPVTKKTQGVSASIEARAIEKGLISGFKDLPEYKTVNLKDQAIKVGTILKENPKLAKQIALGEVEPPQGVLPEMMMNAVENRALEQGDVATLKALATSKTSAEGTLMGQRIRAYGERNTESPVSAIKDVLKARKEAGIKKFGTDDVKKVGSKELKQGKDTIRKHAPTEKSWGGFIESIIC